MIKQTLACTPPPYWGTSSQSTRVMCVTRKGCLGGHREGTTSHSHLSLHRGDVTLFMEGSGASVTAEEHSSIPAHFTFIWVLHVDSRTVTSLRDETHRATTVAILDVSPLNEPARAWMLLPETLRNSLECKLQNKTWSLREGSHEPIPKQSSLGNQRSWHRKTSNKTRFYIIWWSFLSYTKMSFWNNILSPFFHSEMESTHKREMYQKFNLME